MNQKWRRSAKLSVVPMVSSRLNNSMPSSRWLPNLSMNLLLNVLPTIRLRGGLFFSRLKSKNTRKQSASL
jgi:hypothetical protein